MGGLIWSTVYSISCNHFYTSTISAICFSGHWVFFKKNLLHCPAHQGPMHYTSEGWPQSSTNPPLKNDHHHSFSTRITRTRSRTSVGICSRSKRSPARMVPRALSSIAQAFQLNVESSPTPTPAGRTGLAGGATEGEMEKPGEPFGRAFLCKKFQATQEYEMGTDHVVASLLSQREYQLRPRTCSHHLKPGSPGIQRGRLRIVDTREVAWGV